MKSEPKKARIIVESKGETEPLILELGDSLSIGRSRSNQVVVDDPKASRRHAEIRLVRSGRHRLSDLGSVNGTWLNGKRLTAPKDLFNGDEIRIGGTQLVYCAPTEVGTSDTSMDTGTAADLRIEWVVVLVSDIRNYTGMSETLPHDPFSRFIKDWFGKCREIIERHQGSVDKFIGDAVLAYWIIATKSNPAEEIRSALAAAAGLVACAEDFSNRLSEQFPGHAFRIGVGISMGDALLGNIGTGEFQSFTLVGDTVNLAFRLEALTKEKKSPIIVSGNVAEHAADRYRFRDMGKTAVKGRNKPVAIASLVL